MKKRPTDRELGFLLREITGRMPSMPRQEGEVRITQTTYKGADRFELTWRDATNGRRKLWYRNWRHAMAAAKWANAQIDAAKGKTAYTFNEVAEAWLRWRRGHTIGATQTLSSQTLYVYQNNLKRICSRFGKVQVGDIRSVDIDDFLHDLAQRYKASILHNTLNI